MREVISRMGFYDTKLVMLLDQITDIILPWSMCHSHHNDFTWLKFSPSPGESCRNTCYLCSSVLSTSKFPGLLGQSVAGKLGEQGWG